MSNKKDFYKILGVEKTATAAEIKKAYHQLESNTLKQLQDKIDQLQQDNNQLKVCYKKIKILDVCVHKYCFFFVKIRIYRLLCV